MHAALVTLTIDPDQAPAAASALVNEILPAVRSAPGFVAGYWLEPADGQGFSIVLFESEEQHAKRLRRSATGLPRGHHQRCRVLGEWPPPPENLPLGRVDPHGGLG